MRIESNRKGSVLIITLILILILSSFSVALLFPTLARNRAVQFNLQQLQSINISEAASANALVELKEGESGILGSAETPIIFKNGTYYTEVLKNSEDKDLITLSSVGQYQNSTTKMTRKILMGTEIKFLAPASEKETSVLFDFAVFIGGNLLLNTKAKIMGKFGSVHANEFISLEKGATVEKLLSTSKNIFMGFGWNSNIGSIKQHVKKKEIIRIAPAQFMEEAQYVFKNNGKIYNQLGDEVHDSNVDGSFKGWELIGYGNEIANWKYTSKQKNDGYYFFEGNVNIGKRVSTLAGEEETISENETWKLTLISSGHISIRANATIAPYDENKVGLVAGTDLELKGKINLKTGIYSASEQVEIGGEATLHGILYAQNGGFQDEFLKNNVIGNASIIYDEEMEIPLILQNKIKVLATTFLHYKN